MEKHVAYNNLKVYDDAVDLLGIANVTLPDVSFKMVTLSGAGMAGDQEVPLVGMLNSMTLGMKFTSVTDDSVRLMAPKKHQIDLRVSEQGWETEQAEVLFGADKFSLIILPKLTRHGQIAPFTAADVSGEYAVLYYAGYRDGVQLWEIDKMNPKFVVQGVDYLAPVRQALGM